MAITGYPEQPQLSARKMDVDVLKDRLMAEAKNRSEPRSSVLEEAQMHVDGARQSNYGSPHDNHTCTAELFQAWRSRRDSSRGEVQPMDALDVCVFNICQKLSRMANDPNHRDNLVDIAGYVENISRLGVLY